MQALLGRRGEPPRTARTLLSKALTDVLRGALVGVAGAAIVWIYLYG